VLLPFGADRVGHAWLHSTCWRPWHEHRQTQAIGFLRALGFAAPSRKVFVFQDRATRRNDVMAFYGDATSVRPLAFAATIKDMKGLLHNG